MLRDIKLDSSETEVKCYNKNCSQRSHVGGGKYICPHDNLGVRYPDLLLEWHEDNIGTIYDYTHKSGKIIKWKCLKSHCGCHVWETAISNRTDKHNGCPFCCGKRTCEHQNLEMKFPHLKAEWDPNNPKQMKDYSPHAIDLVSWICQNNLCGCHVWKCTIASRTGDKSRGCPFCSNSQLCLHNNLQAKHPELISEWHSDNIKQMKDYPPGSSEKVLWICSKSSCECHVWKAVINGRTGPQKNGCPFCMNRKLCQHNNLEALKPDLKIEWHSDNKPMHLYHKQTTVKVKWICKNKNHIWMASISNRNDTKFKTDCPHCCKTRGYSNSQIKWLTKIENEEGIIIQHALKPDGEYNIPGIGKVDGYCKETNTIFEFHGSYWHGEIGVFDQDKIHPIIKKSYGELYKKTINRDNKIRELGYTLIVKWESEIYPTNKKSNIPC